MALKWQFLGKQELRESDGGGKGYVYTLSLWRTPVPGGWLLLTLNSKSNDPSPVLTFYPDAEHLWSGTTPEEADYLLRPAAGSKLLTPSEQLLRPASEEDGETRLLEE